MIEQKNIWPKKITVDKRIVKILSESTYENFPNALKEIVTNSYDAEASVVTISLDLRGELIEIEDNGVGLNESDFAFYLRIAGSKREKKLVNPSGRHVIGQFGVGFVSIFPFVKNYTIESTKMGSPEVLSADIPCSLYFSSIGKSAKNEIDVSDVKIQGNVKYVNSKQFTQYTKIKLSGFTQLAREFFYPSREAKLRKDSIKSLPGVEKLKWMLCENLPLKYENEELNITFNTYTPNIPFSVSMNNEELFRKVFGKDILEIHKGEYEEIGSIKYRYFIATSRRTVKPVEARFLKIRNLNIGVGDRTTFGLGTEVGGARSRLAQLTGEIHVLEGLNDLISVSRDKFNYHPDFEKLRDIFIKKLTNHSNRLEQEHNIKKFVKDSTTGSKITNVKLLDKKKFERKVTNFKNKLPDQKILQGLGSDRMLIIKGRKLNVIHDDWNYKKEFFQACRLEGKNLFINSSYPLFRGTKYTDIFIKIHSLLALKLQAREIKEDVYESFLKDILIVYKDYIKE